MKARTFDKKFDAGADVTAYLDLSKARRPGHEQKRVNVDFHLWMIHSLDREAERLGVSRQSLIVTVHGPAGDWSIFRRENAFSEQTVGRKMDLSPSAARRENWDSPL